MTTNTAPDHIAEAREEMARLTEYAPLPSWLEVVEPFGQFLMKLHTLREWVEVLGFPASVGECVAEGDQLADLLAVVLRESVAVASSCDSEHSVAVSAGVAALVMGVTGMVGFDLDRRGKEVWWIG